MNDEAKQLANLTCLLSGTNKTFAKQFFGVWLYKDGVVVHNIEALDSEHNGHLPLFRKKLADSNITIRDFSHCECHQCWAMILSGDRTEAGLARNFVWQSAFECVGLPSVPPNPIDHGILPPDFPTIRQHVDFIRSLQKHGLIKCSRMIREGQRRTTTTKSTK